MWQDEGTNIERVPRGRALCGVIAAIALSLVTGHASAQYEIEVFKVIDVRGDFVVRYLEDGWRDTNPLAATHVTMPTWEEELRIQTLSYVYHPAFLTMDIGGGPLLTQYRYESDQGEFDGTDTLFNFNAALTFLSIRPYPTTLYYRRDHPAITTGLSGRFLTRLEEYGIKGRLLPPFSPLQVSWDAGHQESQGAGFGASIDENIDRFDMRTSVPFSHAGMDNINLDYGWMRRRSSSGSPNLPVQSSIITTSDIELRNNQQLGSDRPLALRHFANWRRQETEVRALTENRQFGYRGVYNWNMSEHTRIFSNLALRDSERTESWSKEKEFDVGAIHRLTEMLSVTGNGRVARDEAPGFRRTMSGGQASASYQKALPFGGLGVSVTLSHNRVDQDADADTISILDEAVQLVGTVPVDLNFDFIVTETVVVTNDAQTQTFSEGIDYRLVTIGAVTSIERILTSNIIDGQTVLVSYQALAGGTVSYDTQNRTAGLTLRFSRWANFYLQIRDQVNGLRSGVPTTALNDVSRIGTGLRLDFPLSSGWGVGANVDYAEQDEDISPFASTLFTAYLQTATYWRTSARLGLTRSIVDYEKSFEDTDASGYNLGINSRLPGGVFLAYDATYRDDLGGTITKEDWRHALRLDWGYRQVRFSFRADQGETVQGDSKRENLRVFAEFRRRF